MSTSSAARRGAAPRNALFDEAAVARADQALQALSGRFQGWLEEEVERLVEARREAREDSWSDARLEALWHAAHDLKGLGATYAYPLATRIAASLCRLIETPQGKVAARARPHLIDAHVDAVRAAARDQIKTEDHPVGRALLAALETQVDALGVAPA